MLCVVVCCVWCVLYVLYCAKFTVKNSENVKI